MLNMNRSEFTFADIFTILNGLFGMLAIANLGKEIALVYLSCAVACDGLDGFIARKSKTTKEMGTILDSLADSISFVLFPALCLFYFAANSGLESFFSSLLSFVFLSCGLLRLARFTVQDSEARCFRGLPAPAAALILYLLIQFSARVALFASPMLSALMISRIEYPKIRGKIALPAGFLLLLVVLSHFIPILKFSEFLLFLLLLVYACSPLFSFVFPNRL
jgi:CDP-diacylglycerol--serine O-phosphatidyltransferase